MNVGLFSAVQSQPQGSRPGSPYPDVWPHVGAGAYIQVGAAATQAVEDAIRTSGGDLTVIQVFQADADLGAASAYRSAYSLSGDDDTNGSFYVQARFTSGENRVIIRNDAGSTLRDTLGAGSVVFDGDLHVLQNTDGSSAATGTLKERLDSDASATTLGTYTKTGVGVLDLFSDAGDVKGPTPTVNGSLLGWAYCTIAITEDLESDGGDIWAAFNAAYGDDPKRIASGCWAMLDAIRDAVASADSIVYARVGSQVVAGSATELGTVYTAAGVAP